MQGEKKKDAKVKRGMGPVAITGGTCSFDKGETKSTQSVEVDVFNSSEEKGKDEGGEATFKKGERRVGKSLLV